MQDNWAGRITIGLVHTSRDGWFNKETEQNRQEVNRVIQKICAEESVEVFSSDELEPNRKSIYFNGREILRSNFRYLTSVEDAQAVERYFRAKKVDAVIVSFCNYGNEEAVARLAKSLNVPVLVWGPRDKEVSPNVIYRPTDTQCGIFAATKVLRRFGVKFSYIENCFVEEQKLRDGVRKFISTANAVKKFRTARIAQVSVRPSQFANLSVNEGELLEKFGIEVIPITGAELLDTIAIAQKKHKDEIVEVMAGYEGTVEFAEESQKQISAAIEIAYVKLAERYNCTAIASDCWAEIKKEFGFGPWFTFGNLYDRGLPCTNECDIHGAISSLLAIGASRATSPAFLADLTMRHPSEDNQELLWHMGFAKSLRDEGTKVLVSRTGEANLKLKPGKMSILRFDGDHGDYSCFLGTGESVQGPSGGGSYTYLKVENWPRWEQKFVFGPYVHHVVGVYGDILESIGETCRYIDVTFDSPGP